MLRLIYFIVITNVKWVRHRAWKIYENDVHEIKTTEGIYWMCCIIYHRIYIYIQHY